MADLPFLPKPPSYGGFFSGPGTDPGYITPYAGPARNPFAGPVGPSAADPIQMPFMTPGMGTPNPGFRLPFQPIQMPFMIGGRRLGVRPRSGATLPTRPGATLPRAGLPPAAPVPPAFPGFGSDAVNALLGLR